jgi:hypothetical protein
VSIDSVHKWKSKEGLASLMTTKPDYVYIQGRKIAGMQEMFDGVVSRLPYGEKVVVEHDGKTYGISKNTDGTFLVE